jgi:hypothetical protein
MSHGLRSVQEDSAGHQAKDAFGPLAEAGALLACAGCAWGNLNLESDLTLYFFQICMEFIFRLATPSALCPDQTV